MRVASGRLRFSATEAAAYVALCLAMWPIPLLNRLHVESAALLAAAAFFVAGWHAFRYLDRQSAVRVLAGRLAVLALPLLLMLVPMVWAPNCGWPAGLGFFLLFPVVTVVFAVGLAAAFSRIGLGRRALMWAGVLIMLAGPLYDLGLHPQFYTYNHVFGGVLGPVYDEQLAVRSGLFWFRGLTLVWAMLAFAVAAGRPGRVGLLALVAGTVYFFSGRLGINTGYDDLERALPGRIVTEHFEIRYDPAGRTDQDRHALALLHESEHDRLSRLLGTQPRERIRSYVYTDPWVRQALTGARVTSVAPVWLARPQVHVEWNSLEAVFPHELVHVFSREFGMPVLRASPAVGLVEGLAVALEPPGRRPSDDDLAAAAYHSVGLAIDKALPQALSPWGFWTGRGGVSYTLTGSFLRHLYRTEGAEALKASYSSGALASVYGRPIDALVEEWRAALQDRTWTDAAAVMRAASRLGAPSLFERKCPHYLPAPLRAVERADRAWSRGDTLHALRAVDRALSRAPDAPVVLAAWSRLHLMAGDSASVAARLVPMAADSLTVGTAWARADLLSGPQAAHAYREVAARLPAWARTERLELYLKAEGADGSELPVWAELRKPAYDLLRESERQASAGSWSEAAETARRAADGYRRIGDLSMAGYVRYLADRFAFAYKNPDLIA